MFTDTYLVPAKHTIAEFKDRGSTFIGMVFNVSNQQEAKQLLQQTTKQHPSANHCCYGLILGFDGVFKQSSDDGEPANSAGKPILRAMVSAQITQSLVIVVRYFGGTLLGVPGLIQAYHTAAQKAIEQAGLVQNYIAEVYQLKTDYVHEPEVFRLFKMHKAKVVNVLYEEGLCFTFEIRKSLASQFFSDIKEKPYLQTTFITER
jgi:uncharacterized YigZ family protein|nr:YigZ family protein [Bacteroidia bacterium]